MAKSLVIQKGELWVESSLPKEEAEGSHELPTVRP